MLYVDTLARVRDRERQYYSSESLCCALDQVWVTEFTPIRMQVTCGCLECGHGQRLFVFCRLRRGIFLFFFGFSPGIRVPQSDLGMRMPQQQGQCLKQPAWCQ